MGTEYIVEALHNEERVETKDPNHKHLFTGKSHNGGRWIIITND